MEEYHKIQSLFKRDMESRTKPLIVGAWTSDTFEYLADNTWAFTEKVDGTNIRVMFENGSLTFGGRTDNAQIHAHLYKALQGLFMPKLDVLAGMFEKGVCLYGEGYGAGIQKCGGNYRQDKGFVLFDVRVGALWLQRCDVEDVAGKLGIDIVPVIGCGTLHDAVAMARSGLTSRWGDFLSEGIVARPLVEMLDRRGNRIIAKIKHADFVRPAPAA